MNLFVLNKATGSDDSPTPGYLYVEIAKMTLNVNTIPKLVKYLSLRLTKDNANIKLKTLLVIRHTCRKGDKSFRRAIQSCGIVADVKACLTYTGKPHQLKGDQPFRAVRDAAKETLEAIFDNSQDYSSSQSITGGGGALSGRIQGYGNTNEHSSNDLSAGQDGSGNYFSGGGNKSHDASIKDSIYSIASKVTSTVNEYASNYSSGGTGTNSSGTNSGAGGAGRYNNGTVGAGGKKYGGIGNPNFSDPRNEPPTFINRVKNRLEKFNDQGASGVISDFMNKSGSGDGGSSYSPQKGSSSAYTSPSLGDNKYSNNSYNSYGADNNNSGSGGRTRQRGQIGGVWGSQPSPFLDPRSPRQNQDSKYKSRVGQAGNAASDGSYEKSLLEELCGSFGVRIVPPKDKLKNFCAACETLDPEIVMPMIFNLLLNGSIDGSTDDTSDWRAQHKALCVCEALIQASGCDRYVDDLDDNADILEQIIQNANGDVKSIVRNKAKKVWRLLYGEDPDLEEESPEQQIENNQAGNTVEEDLLGFSENANGSSEGDSNNGMYDMLDSDNKGPSESEAHSSMFNGLSPNTASGDPPSTSRSMFANMNVKTTSTSNTANQLSEPDANDTDLMNLLEGANETSKFESAANQLDELSLGGASTTTKTDSQFSFLNRTQSDNTVPKKGFAFINTAAEPVTNTGKGNVVTAFDNLVKTNLSPRRNPIPKQPNMGNTASSALAQPLANPINPVNQQQQKGTSDGLLSGNLRAMYQIKPHQMYPQQYMHGHAHQQVIYQHQPPYNQVQGNQVPGFMPPQHMIYQPHIQYNQQIKMQTRQIPSSPSVSKASNPGVANSPKQPEKPDKFEDIVKASMAGM